MAYTTVIADVSVLEKDSIHIFNDLEKKNPPFLSKLEASIGHQKHFYKGVGRRKESSLCFKDLYNKLTQIKAYAQTTAVNGIFFDEAKNKRNGHTGGKIYDCLLPFFGLTGTDLGNHLLDLLFFLIYESVSINLL